VKGSSEAGTKLCLAALSRVVKARMQRPEDDGSAQHVGGHGLVGHHSVARTSGARENSPGLKADGLACVAVGGPAQSRWEGYGVCVPGQSWVTPAFVCMFKSVS